MNEITNSTEVAINAFCVCALLLLSLLLLPRAFELPDDVVGGKVGGGADGDDEIGAGRGGTARPMWCANMANAGAGMSAGTICPAPLTVLNAKEPVEERCDMLYETAYPPTCSDPIA